MFRPSLGEGMAATGNATRPTVVFDIGGVLLGVDFMRACARLEALGAVPAALILDAIAKGEEKHDFDCGRLTPQQFAARFCAAIDLRLPFEEFAQIWCDIFTEQRAVTGLLDTIGEKADLMLLSTTDPLHIDYVREHYDFLGKFGERVFSYEVGHTKPAHEIFERALALIGPDRRALYFDDVAEYAAAARSLGLPAEQFVDAAKLKSDLARFGVL